MKKNLLTKMGAIMLAVALAVPSYAGIAKATKNEITAYANTVTSGDVSGNDVTGGDGKEEIIIKPDQDPPEDSEQQKENNKNINDLIDKVTQDKTASEALEEIKKGASISDLASAMQSAVEVLNKIKDLEEKYVEQKGISISIDVNKNSNIYEDSSKVSMIGAALNVDEGKVSLVIESASKTIDVSVHGFSNNVQLDISLLHNGVSIHDLNMPITITTPVPKGINPAHMKILHFYDNGTAETVRWKNNGNGTVTFTVKSFSTFIFAEEAENNNNNNTSKDDGKDNAGSDNNTTEAANNDNNQATSPKTGDIADRIPYIILLAAVMGVVSVTIIKKKYQ